MIRTRIAWVAAFFAGAVGVGVGAAWDRLRLAPPTVNAAEVADRPTPAAADKDKDKAPDVKARPADQEAVRAAVKDFIKAFEKGDAEARSFPVHRGRRVRLQRRCHPPRPRRDGGRLHPILQEEPRHEA